jgi:putative transcriptional regulator
MGRRAAIQRPLAFPVGDLYKFGTLLQSHPALQCHMRPLRGEAALALLSRMFLVLGGLLVAAPLLGAVPPRLELEPEYPSLVGQVLIASPLIGDPRFRRTVILMVKHSKTGALGITINRPLGEHSLPQLLGLFGESDSAVEGKVQIFAGGPVQPGVCLVVHSAEYNRTHSIAVKELASVTRCKEVLGDIGRKVGPQKALVAFGYAGWGPGQLEAELARNEWATVTADANLVFDITREGVWDAAMARRPRDQ